MLRGARVLPRCPNPLISTFRLAHAVSQALVVYDVDGSADSLLAVTLECNEGEFILGNGSSLTFNETIYFDESDESGADESPLPSGVLSFNGTAANINRAMRNLRYRGLSGRAGQDVIRITVTDNPGPCPGDFNTSLESFNTTAVMGVNGTAGTTAAPCALGGPQTTESTIQVFLSAINRGPSVNVPASGASVRTSVDALRPAEIGAGGGLSVEDPDARETAYYSAGGLRIEGPVSVVVACESGRVSLGARGGLSFSEGEGVSDPIMRFSGGIDHANRALETLTYRCSSAHGCGAGTHTIAVSVDDNGFTGKGGPLSANATFSVQVSTAVASDR